MKKSKDSKNPEKSKSGSIASVIGENNRLTKAISVLSLILIMSGLFAFIITGLYRYDLIEIPAFILNILKPDNGLSSAEKDDSNIYEFLTDNAGSDGHSFDDSGYSLEITLENIKDILLNIPFPDNLYLEFKADYYKDDGITATRTEEMSLWKKGGKYKYTLNINSEPEETYINDSKNELIENHQTGGKLIRAVSESFSFENIPHIQNINYYLDLLESGEITNCSVSQNINSSTVLIKYYMPQLDQREYISISLDTGIVKEVKSYVGQDNDLFYHCETTVSEAYYDGDAQAEAKTSIKDSLFAVR